MLAREYSNKLGALQWDTKLRFELMSIECDLELGDNGEKVTDRIAELKKMMLLEKSPDIESLNQLADYYIFRRRYIRALVLVQCMCDVYQQIASSPDELIDKQVYCLYKVYKIIDYHPGTRDKVWAAKIETSLGCMLTLPSFEGLEVEKKNIYMAVYQNFLGSICNSLSMHRKGLQYSEEAAALAEGIESAYIKNTVLRHSFYNCFNSNEQMRHKDEADKYKEKIKVAEKNLKKHKIETMWVVEFTENYLRQSKLRQSKLEVLH